MASKYQAAYASPKGAGDARPTALQIIKDESLEGKLEGKAIFITGCSSGIGIETARAFFATGATLYLTARNLEKVNAALPDLIVSERVHILELDLGSLDSVRTCANDFLSRSKKLNLFIANAGTMASPEGHTKDGFETQFGTNHLAHFLLFNQLKPILLASSSSEFNSRAIFLSSIGHRIAEPKLDNLNLEGEYNEWSAYGASKTAAIWTANQIDRLYGPVGLHSFAVHPGAIDTDLQRHLSDEVKRAVVTDELVRLYQTPQQGAATTVWAATAKALEGVGGKYLEQCQVSKPWPETGGQWTPGYSAWAYDPEKEKKLWLRSLELVGLPEN
jgi:NAD(P)-dependent dehydrogenase (short-subunit alcohol dehydrogenase family)